MKPFIAAVAATVFLAVPARAAVPVIDEFSNAVRTSEAAQQIAKWGSQLSAMQQQYQQLQSTYYAMAHVTDLGSAVSALGTVGIRNPLPIDPSSVQNMMNGSGGVSGVTSSLSSIMSSIGNSNRVYTSPGSSFMDQENNRSAGGIAGAQALAMELYRAAGDRMQHIDQLRCQIPTASDPATREALIAQISAESTAIQNQTLQAQALGNYMQGAIANREQRQQEKRRMDINDMLTEARSKGFAQ